MTENLRDQIQEPAVHFIGIGGVGMSGIAKVAHNQGLSVSGSDLKASRYTAQLEELGIPVSIGHSPSNIPDGNPLVIVSTAILENNPELHEAKRRGLKISHRAEMLAYLGRDLKTIAVAGTHGKTTTSSMLAHVLDGIGDDPTFLIGGIVDKYGTNARSGEGPRYVVEADESDKSFTFLDPQSIIVTNIEPDHLDHYADLDEIYSLFEQFMMSVPEDGNVIVCADDRALVDLSKGVNGKVLTYGFADDADYKIESYEHDGIASAFSLRLPDGRLIDASIKQNPGKHNVQNAASVLAMVDALGLDVQAAAASLSEFTGVRRRFDLVGSANDIKVFDDYAHHPTEIASTISAARDSLASAADEAHIHVLFQPHRYSRAKLFTEVLRDEFASAFDEADTVTFMDVFPAGETPVPGVTGQTFLDVVAEHVTSESDSGKQVPELEYAPKRIDVPSIMAAKAKPGDIILTMGAGDVTSMGAHILDSIELLSAHDAVSSATKA